MRRSSFQKVDAENASVDVMLSRDIVSQYDKIAAVADRIDDVVIVAAEAPTTAIVAASMGVVTAVGSNIGAVVDVLNNTANIATIIDNFANINTVATSVADVNDVADSIQAVNTVNDNLASIHTAVANIANVGTVAGSIASVNTVANGMVDILTANSNIADITIAANNTAHINQVAADTTQINEIVTTVVPNMAEILLADDRAATATAMATTATTQAGLANTARVAAEVAQGIAENEADAAALSAVAADTSADLAAVSAGTASTKAGEAAASAIAAHNSELAAAAILDAFDDRYLGAFATNPTVDNDGNALQSGAIYYNTVAHNLRVYDSSLVDWISLSAATFAGMQDVSLTSPTTGDVLKWNGTDWVNTKEVALNSVQLLGGAGTQGTMTWNADEETVDIVQNGAVLQVGQEVQTHVRNNTASTINNGTVVMATGTVGASGRITVAPYDNVADVKYVIGVVTEGIAAGDDGKVTHFGKVRGINTSAWNEGDVLYTTTAGGLTNVVPTSGKKLAVAFVITKHAINGTIMVRVNGVDESVLDSKAPLASPALTGTPTAPTATVGDSSTKLATTAFVNAEIANDAVPRITSTDNQLVRFDGTSGAIQGSGVVVDDNVNMGVGTSNPDTAIHIVKADTSNNFTTKASITINNSDSGIINRKSGIKFKINTVDAGGIYSNFDKYSSGVYSSLIFATSNASNDVERMRIDASGNLGLGVTPSAWGSNRKAIDIGSVYGAISGGMASEIYANAYYNGTGYIYKTTYQASYYYQNAGIHTWLTAPSGTAGNAITWSTAMTLDANSNLTIKSPTSTDSILAIAATSTNVSQRLHFKANGTLQTEIYNDSTQAIIKTVTNTPLKLGTNNTVSVVIPTTGGIQLPNTAITGATTLDWYEEATATLTVTTGMTTTTTGTATLTRVGNTVSIEIPTISGTSNATSFIIGTLPTNFRPIGGNRSIIVPVVDNGGATALSLCEINTAGILTIYKTYDGGAFTASGTKSIKRVSSSYLI